MVLWDYLISKKNQNTTNKPLEDSKINNTDFKTIR